MSSPRSARGFSLVELMMASALIMVVLGSVFQALHPAYGAFKAEPERADVQQRLRAGLAAVAETLANAGAGPTQGPAAGPLISRTAALFPSRLGRRNADAPGTSRSDVVTVLEVERGAAQTTLAQPLAANGGVATINMEVGCPVADPSCGFAVGMTAMALGDGGRFDLFTVSSVTGASLTLMHNSPASAFVYPANTPLVQARSRTLYLKSDPSNDLFQLMRYDGDDGSDVPIAEHVVGLSFRYRGDADPPRPIAPPIGVSTMWSTYGPPPPDAAAQPVAYPPGENCVFNRDGAANSASRLGALGFPGLVDLSPQQLADGPWCADDTDANRFDADLLRIRSVSITLRVQAAAASLRGAVGPLFLRAGTSRSALALVPDAEATIEIAPVNLNPGRWP